MRVTSPGLMNTSGIIASAGLDPMEWLISVAGSSSTLKRLFMNLATASLNSIHPLSAYPRFSSLFISSTILART